MEYTPDPYTRRPEDAREPPQGFAPTLKFLGPSLIPSHLSGGGIYGGVGQAAHQALPALPSTGWTLIFAVAGVAIVLSGTYRFLEKLLTVMVVTFTLITLSCAVLLQFTEYALTWNDVRAGLSFEFPALAVAAAMDAGVQPVCDARRRLSRRQCYSRTKERW